MKLQLWYSSFFYLGFCIYKREKTGAVGKNVKVRVRFGLSVYEGLELQALRTFSETTGSGLDEQTNTLNQF